MMHPISGRVQFMMLAKIGRVQFLMHIKLKKNFNFWQRIYFIFIYVHFLFLLRHNVPKVNSDAIYDAPKITSGAICDAPQVRSGAIFDAPHRVASEIALQLCHLIKC